jgi:hypothetical protein
MLTPRPSRSAAVLCCALLAVALAGCGKEKSSQPAIRHPQDFLPQTISGMTRNGAVLVATNVTELQAIVDGGYQVYTQHDFRELAEQYYTGTVGGNTTTLRARVFDQGTVTGATALFADINVDPGGCITTTEVGDESRTCSGLLSQTLQFRRDIYWVELVIQDTSPDGRSVLDLLAQHIDGEIQGK